jgi:hypothetical protein
MSWLTTSPTRPRPGARHRDSPAADQGGGHRDRLPSGGSVKRCALRAAATSGFRQVRFRWSEAACGQGAGSNRRPSAFQVNRAQRCADLRKRTSLTSGTALGGRCNLDASRTHYTPSTRQDNNPTQDQRDHRKHDHGRHPVGSDGSPATPTCLTGGMLPRTRSGVDIALVQAGRAGSDVCEDGTNWVATTGTTQRHGQ